MNKEKFRAYLENQINMIKFIKKEDDNSFLCGAKSELEVLMKKLDTGEFE